MTPSGEAMAHSFSAVVAADGASRPIRARQPYIGACPPPLVRFVGAEPPRRRHVPSHDASPENTDYHGVPLYTIPPEHQFASVRQPRGSAAAGSRIQPQRSPAAADISAVTTGSAKRSFHSHGLVASISSREFMPRWSGWIAVSRGPLHARPTTVTSRSGSQ